MLHFEEGREHETDQEIWSDLQAAESLQATEDLQSTDDLQATADLEAELVEQLSDTLPPWLAPPLPPEAPPTTRVEPQRVLPVRSTTVAALAQIPATIEAAFLDVSPIWLTAQVIIVAIMGLCLMAAEWMSINRSGLAREAPQPNLVRPQHWG